MSQHVPDVWRERAEKAEAEVARLTKENEKYKAFIEKGLDVQIIDAREVKPLQDEVARLKAQTSRLEEQLDEKGHEWEITEAEVARLTTIITTIRSIMDISSKDWSTERECWAIYELVHDKDDEEPAAAPNAPNPVNSRGSSSTWPGDRMPEPRQAGGDGKAAPGCLDEMLDEIDDEKRAVRKAKGGEH